MDGCVLGVGAEHIVVREPTDVMLVRGLGLVRSCGGFFARAQVLMQRLVDVLVPIV